MISGPVVANTAEGLRDLLRRDSNAIEDGLTPLVDDLGLPGAHVDVVARDAADRPVLVLFAVQDESPLPRVLALRDFLVRSGRSLQRALPEVGIDFSRGCRLLVLGLQTDSLWIRDLEALAMPELQAACVDTLSVAGERRVVVQTVVGVGADGEEDSFQVPTGLEDQGLRTLCAELFGILERLEPRAQVRGDRFSRSLAFRGGSLCSLQIRGADIFALVPGTPPLQLRCMADVHEVGDLVLRRYLDIVEVADGQLPEPASADSGAFGGLRRRAAAAQVSQEEFEALRDEGQISGHAARSDGITWTGPP